MTDMVSKALGARRESKHVEFKRSFDPKFLGDWCELIKDIVAIANSGGGVIVIGLENNGDPSVVDVSAVCELDQAEMLDKVRKYAGSRFDGIEVIEAEKAGSRVAILEISASRIPLVFERVGTYDVGEERQKQKNAFSVGSVYFRHGAKSEPGTSDDLQKAIDRHLELVRHEWLDGVRKVVRAPQGSRIAVFDGEVVESDSPNATPIRLVDDPQAPGYRLIDQDTTYPYRQTELIAVVNGMLPDGIHINSYDLLCFRRAHGIDLNPQYSHTPKYGTTQYSDAFAKHLVNCHKEDQEVFTKVREWNFERIHNR